MTAAQPHAAHAAAAASPAAAETQDHDRVQGFLMSLLVILVSEIGDKTFLIAAVLAMRNPRALIFSAAMSALLLMTLLSALMGQVLPNLLSKQYTQILASALFIVFGLRLLREGWLMSGNEGQEELEEVTQELAGSGQKEKDDDIEKNAAGADKPKDKEKLLSEAESSTTAAAAAGNPGMKPFLVRLWVSLSDRFRSAAGVFFSPVWIQAFVLTFVAEWGDRSQIATVALAGAEDFWWVSLGCILGHAVCSCIAVIGGRMLAARISVKSVTIIGAVMFVLCGVVGLWEFVAENYYDD